MKINKLSPLSNKYLQILQDIAKPPKELYTIGVLPAERQLSVAIIGSRKPTAYGREVTEMIASNLAKKGVIIISGLALGIDAIAHKSALDARGTTIAVLGNGLPKIYPSTNQALAERIIASGGAIISEYPEGTPPVGFRLLERNRLVSGLADAIIITEAASRSGTLNTASHALEQGKFIFAVPGNITSPLSTSCNNLIRQGAIPLTNPNDIFEVLAPQLIESPIVIPTGQNEVEIAILKLIKAGYRDGDDIQRHSGLAASDLNQSLTMLEISGMIKSLGANQWALK